MGVEKAVLLASHPTGSGIWTQLGLGALDLVPVANRPLLFHNLEALATAGVRSVALVVDPASARAIRATVEDGRAWRMSVECIEAPAEAGALGQLRAADAVLDGHPFVAQRSDVLLRDRIRPLARRFDGDDALDALALELGPSVAPAVVGMCFLRAEALRSLSAVGGALELDGLVADLGAQGGRVSRRRIDGCLPCGGDREALLAANRRLLDELVPGATRAEVIDSELQGLVRVGPGARLHRTLVRGPAIIGAGAQLSNAYVGPYTSIGPGVVVDGCELEHSIVLPDAELRYLGARLESSVVGRGARIVREPSLPQALRLVVADGAEVTLA
jgi:glucose-1-phosphate thymidylyltransferase